MSDAKKPLLVKCPTCHAEIIWSEESPHRPFCSERCRNKDFIDWANEEQRIGGDTDYNDLLSDDLQK
jgi:uncharacterized protein